MENKENELEYLQMLISFYVDREEDEMFALLLTRISQGLERMKACA